MLKSKQAFIAAAVTLTLATACSTQGAQSNSGEAPLEANTVSFVEEETSDTSDDFQSSESATIESVIKTSESSDPENEVRDVIPDESYSFVDGVWEICAAGSDSIETLKQRLQSFDTSNRINHVYVYNNALNNVGDAFDFEGTNFLTDGSVTNGMWVYVIYDNEESWMEINVGQ